MSQTETMMVLVLGFVLALICVLFFARLIWNIGQRIARRRAEKAKPALIRSLEADRDQLRASHAMMTQRLNSGLAEAKAKVIEQQAEVSRHRNRLLDLTETVNAQSAEMSQLDQIVRQLRDQTELQNADLDQRAELMAQMRNEAEAREDDIQMLKAELQKTGRLLEESKHQLERIEAERADAVERHALEREAHARLMQHSDTRERDWASQQQEIRQPTRESLAYPEAEVVSVKPAGTTQPQTRFGFDRPDDGLTLPPVPQRPTHPTDLANLLQNARRNMMERQSEARKTEPAGKRSRAIANVVSLAQKMRNEREE